MPAAKPKAATDAAPPSQPDTRETASLSQDRGGLLEKFGRSANELIFGSIVVFGIGSTLSIFFALQRVQLTPLYNDLPLALHSHLLFAAFTGIATFAVAFSGFRVFPGAASVSPTTLAYVAALGVDLAALGGRRLGSHLGGWLGPEWGAFAVQLVLGVLPTAGIAGCSAALLRFRVSQEPKTTPQEETPMDRVNRAVAAAIALVCTVAGAGMVWRLRDSAGFVIDQYGADKDSWISHAASHPERALLVVSAAMHFVAFVVPSKSGEQLGPRRPAPRRRSLFTTLLPHAIRVTHIALVGAVWYVWIHNAATPPYATADGSLFVHRSVRGRSGQVVVADNRRDGYRFLRVDNSLVGGRWFEYDKNARGGYTPRLGDSIFAAFFVQEFGWFAQRTAVEEAARGFELLTGVDFGASVAAPDRALIIGLGVGVAAVSSVKRGVPTDYVEYDAEVASAARDFFGMYPENVTHAAVIGDGADFIRRAADEARRGSDQRWSIIVQDCFSAGELPVELFTREFWADVQDVLQPGGVVVTNVVGLPGSLTMRAVAVTLASSFAQCRVFTDENGGHDPEERDKVLNTVFICSNAHDPILTFRRPTRADAQGSPSRARVYSSLLRSNEVQIEEIVQDEDWGDESMVLRRGSEVPVFWQKDLAISAWHSMRKILTPEMWMTW